MTECMRETVYAILSDGKPRTVRDLADIIMPDADPVKRRMLICTLNARLTRLQKWGRVERVGTVRIHNGHLTVWRAVL